MSSWPGGNDALTGREFLVESSENLDRLDQALIALETRPADSALLADIFRTIHTLKGTAGFLGFSKLEDISHVGESLLSALRDQVLTLTPAITHRRRSPRQSRRRGAGRTSSPESRESSSTTKMR